MPKQFNLFIPTNLTEKCRMKLVSPITNSSKRCKTVQHVGYINFVEHCAVCKWQLRNFGHAQKGKFSRVLETDTAAPWLFYLLLFLPARLPLLFSFAKQSPGFILNLLVPLKTPRTEKIFWMELEWWSRNGTRFSLENQFYANSDLPFSQCSKLIFPGNPLSKVVFGMFKCFFNRFVYISNIS